MTEYGLFTWLEDGTCPCWRSPPPPLLTRLKVALQNRSGQGEVYICFPAGMGTTGAIGIDSHGRFVETSWDYQDIVGPEFQPPPADRCFALVYCRAIAVKNAPEGGILP